MRLLIVIVNYRTPGLTLDCLRSIELQLSQIGPAGSCHVVVTDGASGDNSVPLIRTAIEQNNWHGWIDLRPLERNGGFAYGNNQGVAPYLQSHKPQYVLLLNPDTIVRDRGLIELVEHLDRHSTVGIAGSRLEDPDGTPQNSSFRFHSALGDWESMVRLGVFSKLLAKFAVAPPLPSVPTNTDWVAGASMIVRKEVFEQVGLLDDAYFMYFEETDFCFRAKRAGWQVMYVPASRVVHLVGQASGVTDKTKLNKRRPAYWFESRRRFFVKNRGLMHAAFADVLHVGAFLLWRLRMRLMGKADPDPQHYLADFVSHSVFVKGR